MFSYVKKGDIILIVLLLALSLAMIFFIKSSRSGGESYVSIQQDGEEIDTIEFNEENIGKIYRVDSDYGYNIFEIGDGRIRSIESDCKEKVHIKQGWISEPGQTLVCLPHRLLVEVRAKEDRDSKGQDQLDLINY